MKEIKGNIIKLAKEARFDVIVQGCNCFCRMGSGLAPQIKENFPSAWLADEATESGDINKLGCYTFGMDIAYDIDDQPHDLTIINAYTQFSYDASKKPLDYEALTLALKKINHNYKGRSIGVPQIGAKRGGGDWDRIKMIIETELKDMDVIIIYSDGVDKW